jgi:hypothetical protein
MMASFVIHTSGGSDAGAIIPFVVIGFILLAIVIRFAAGSTDDGRIRENIEQQGGKITSINWSPFGRGWFGSKNERIYEVVYEDAQGRIHQAYCKTSMFSGVYWTDDKVVGGAVKPDSQPDANPGTDNLAAENQKLKAEIERLKKL